MNDHPYRLQSSETSFLDPCPDPTASDYFAGLVKAGISAFPDWGGPAAELFGMITAPLLGKRRDHWFEELRVRFNTLSQTVEGMTIESQARNDQFISVLLQATQSAVKTHEAEKLEALRNAVVNVASGKEPDGTRQALFLSFIDRFTPLHFGLLRFFQDPRGFCEAKGFSPKPERDHQPIYLLLLDCMPSLANHARSPVEGREGSRWQFLDALVSELASAALISPDLRDVSQNPPAFSRWTTHLGDDFLDFISDQVEENNSHEYHAV